MRRPSRRYLVFRIVSDTSFPAEKLSLEIEQSLRGFFGDIGALQAFPRLISYDAAKMMGVIRCSTEWVDRVRTALALTTQIDGQTIGFLVLRSSGTIASLRRSIGPIGNPTRTH